MTNETKTPSLKAQKSALTKEIKQLEIYLGALHNAYANRKGSQYGLYLGEPVGKGKIWKTETELKQAKANRAELDKPVIEFTTSIHYWDCECEANYIHSKEFNYCPKCKCWSEDMPDSHNNEIKYLYNPLLDKAKLK